MIPDSTHVAFLRAINVRGHKMIAMRDLTSVFTRAGCRDVRSVIQSGNVLFTPPNAVDALDAIASRLHKEFGEVALFCRKVSDVDRLVRQDPFRHFAGESGLKFYVAFLARAPQRRTTLPVLSAKERMELIAIKSREAFLVSRRKPNGFYGFPNNFIEDVLGVPATTRNWSTLLKIASLTNDA